LVGDAQPLVVLFRLPLNWLLWPGPAEPISSPRRPELPDRNTSSVTPWR
jgi:hypothetical protein